MKNLTEQTQPLFNRTAKVMALGLASFFCATGLQAKGVDSGGGDAIVCKKPFQKETVHLADTFNMQNSKRKELFGNDLNWSTLPRAMDAALNELYPELSKKVSNVKLTWEYVNSPLPELDDDGIVLRGREFAGCREQQLAIQNKSTGVVKVYKPLWLRLSDVDRAYLVMHEKFINISQNYKDTSPIREKILKVAESPHFFRVILEEYDWIHKSNRVFADALPEKNYRITAYLLTMAQSLALKADAIYMDELRLSALNYQRQQKRDNPNSDMEHLDWIIETMMKTIKTGEFVDRLFVEHPTTQNIRKVRKTYPKIAKELVEIVLETKVCALKHSAEKAQKEISAYLLEADSKGKYPTPYMEMIPNIHHLLCR